MRGRVQKWGNSLAIRIPKPFAEQIGLNEGAPTEVTIIGDALSIRRAPTAEYSLDDLLAGVTEENIHGEFDTGRAAGRESW